MLVPSLSDSHVFSSFLWPRDVDAIIVSDL